MKIRGNTVGTTMPRADYAQKNPKKADFIKNKPAPFVVSHKKPEGPATWFNQKEDIDQPTGDEHIMAVDLNMGQNRLFGLPTPVDDDEAVTKRFVTETVDPVEDSVRSVAENVVKVAKKVDALADTVSSLHSEAGAILETASGEVITVSDASDLPLAGLKVFGKTTQDGTPTPDAPAALESVGDVAVTVACKNLLPSAEAISKTVAGITFTSNGDGTYTIEGDAEWSGSIDINLKEPVTLVDGMYIHLFNTGTLTSDAAFTYKTESGTTDSWHLGAENRIGHPTKLLGERIVAVGVYVKKDVTLNITLSPMFCFDEKATEFEPYKGNKLPISTDYGLPGIPVESGGNYTDPVTKQQWICDEVDFEKGVYVQRVKEIDFGSITWTYDTSVSIWVSGRISDTILNSALLCEIVPYQRITISDSKIGTSCNTPYNIWVRNGSTTVPPTGKAVYQLAEPVEHTLSHDQLAAFAQLHSNYPNTTVFNDKDAGMEVKYVADTKLYIDKKFNELAAALVSNV